MKNLKYFLLFAFTLSMLTSCLTIKNKKIEELPLIDKLKNLKGVTVTKISTPYGYKEAYLLMIEQPIDHRHPEKGTFQQRVWLSFVDYDRPNVIITDGYSLPRNGIQEITQMVNGNQIMVEHRYFGKSVPEEMDWTKLNLYQATNDLHRIRTILGEVFTMPWVSSGISKGGQTTIAYRFFFPDDVSASVPYVAPHTFAREDDRVLTFLADEVGSNECRNKVIKFQHDVLANKDSIMPKIQIFAKNKRMTFEAVGGFESGFEHGVLEFSFAFWQWGTSCSLIPNDVTNWDSTLYVLKYVNPFDFFCDQEARDLRPYFYQALTEMGIYTYTTEPFKEYLEYAQNPTFDFTMEGKIETHYSDSLNIAMNEWLQNEGNNFVYIYGGIDPWGACAVEVDNTKTNALKLVAPNGSHTTRINSFDKETQTQILDSLEKWMNFEL
ncbi:MAG: hypothetical protein JXL97_04160 [Bacteroidales bacterium]|nr:hypothetical protein [Bacteroidales bacterium]